jgi:cyclic nucleotide gated channel
VTYQVIGAFWYLFAIEREESCWHKKCREQKDCLPQNYYCGHNRNKALDQHLYDACPFIDPDQITNSTVFNFGIFTDVLSSGVVESRYFSEKFFYCFWWGLRNLGLAIYIILLTRFLLSCLLSNYFELASA